MTDEKGNPLPGARVAGVNAAIPAPLGALSELAARHLASDWSVTTDENGQWILPLPDGSVPLLFEAPGRAAEWRILPEDRSAAVEVSLSKGAALKMTTDRVDPNLIVTLSREDTGAAISIPVDEQPLVWARWAKSSVLTWSSLPPGVYGIYAKYPEPRYFMQAATKLASVTLSPAGQQDVQVALPPVRRVARSSAALFLQGISRADLGEGLEASGRDAAGNPRRAEHFVEGVIGGSVLHLNADGVGAPFYAMTEDRFFSTIPSVAEAGRDANAQPLRTAVHPRADAYLRLRFAEKELQIPDSGTAVLRDCNDGDGVTVPVEIRRDHLARFTAAAGCRSLVLEFEPFEPVVSHRLLKPGDQSLGEFILRGAGSADVRVVRDQDGAPVSGATVQIVVPNEETPAERPVVVAEALTDEGGWTHLSGLPAYRDLQAVAKASDGDRSDATVLRVEPRERGVVDPLVVVGPAVLLVEAKIDKAFRARFLSARVATLLVRPADPSRQAEKRQENTQNEDEPVRFGRLHPGRWVVSGVVNVAGTYSLIEIEEVELKAGETRHVEATVTPNVFEGIVTSEGNGVAARVIVDDRGQRIYFNSDASGMFRAVLQNRGVYRVAAARLKAQGNIIPIGDVAFTDPSRRVEIAIPKGGSVTTRVRSDGRPVPRAVVWVSRRDNTGVVEGTTNRGRTTDPAGEATFDDLAPGIWTFTVRENEERRGAEKSIAVGGGESLSIDLDLASAAAVRGIIRSLGGSPLPRARIECLFVGPSGHPDRASAESDADGKFAIHLIPPPPPSALCSVIGPMGTVDAVRVVPGSAADITVPAATATLRIPDWNERGSQGVFWLVAPDGRPISVDAVAAKIGRFAMPLTIPALAAGRWKLVRVESLPQWLALAGGIGSSLPAVAEITLQAGTTETIQLYEKPSHLRDSN